jgi:hypothetical protein
MEMEEEASALDHAETKVVGAVTSGQVDTWGLRGNSRTERNGKVQEEKASAQHDDDGSSRRGYHKCQSQKSYERAPVELGYGRVVREDGLL